MPVDASTPVWHASDATHALAILGASDAGLSSAQATERLQAHGPNALPMAGGRHPVLRFAAHFHDALIYLLLVAATAAFFLGHRVDAAVILLVVVVNAIVGFVQEGRAEQSLDAIRDLIAPLATALRDGRRISIDARHLVPGDIVILEAGNRVPADLRLLRAHGLLVDEAMLTGECASASKHVAPVAAEAALGDQHNMAFSGTLVLAGAGTGAVVATGLRTQIGGISGLIAAVEATSTPLLRQIARFSRGFTGIVLAASGMLLAFAVLVRGFAWPDALIAVVALAVGVIPEGLPAVITITLAVGVRRMAARNAVTRKLPAVETLGATSVICTDKTGTLTRNEMTARRIVTVTGELVADGSGYGPGGTIGAAGDQNAVIAAATPLLRAAVLCNDASLHDAEGQWTVQGDPMEGALLTLAGKASLDAADLRHAWPRLDEIPFDAALRFMATLHRGPDGASVAFVKGAPEALFAMAPPPDHAAWTAHIARAGSGGERVLAFGTKRLADGQDRLTSAALADGVEFLGLVGFIDPPRSEAMAAIAECRSAGIAVKMITGDHVETALAIARKLALADDPQAITGAEIEVLSDAQLEALVERVSVFARTSPGHKLRIVRALQADGAVVAMTGDGVNDAPSLRQADVGVAMGRKGTEAAKEAASIVLLDDDFTSIVHAVKEGRTVHDNIRKVITWTLPTNGGETLAVVLAILAGFVLPMTATQILWTNLVLASTLGLALAFEPSEPGIMDRPPRAARAALLSRVMLVRVVATSVVLASVTLGLFFWAQGAGRDLVTARTMVVNLVVACGVAHLFNVRFLHGGSVTRRGVLGTPPVIAAVGVVALVQALFTYAPFMQRLFDSQTLGVADVAAVLGLAAAVMVLLEGEKLLVRRLGWG